MSISKDSIGNSEQLEQLRKILLKEDREELLRIKKVLEEKEELGKHVSPIIEDHILSLKQNFPKEFEAVVDKQIETKLRDSQDELVAILFPEIGTMINKYVAYQMSELRESIDARITAAKNKGPLGWIRKKVFGIGASEWILAKSGEANVEGVYVIEMGSGLLLGSASNVETMDKDLLAGMLTAIQSFAEDAFMKGQQKVDIIEYDKLSIFTQSYPKFYIAVALNGRLTNSDKEQLSNELLSFVNKNLKKIIIRKSNNIETEIHDAINKRFFKNAETKDTQLILDND